MKKILIVLLLVSFCGGSSETATVEETTTTSTSSTTTELTTTTTTQPTTTTTKVPQAPALKLDLCNEVLNPTETETWEYEIEIINFNSRIKAIEYVLYFNDEEVDRSRESYVVQENENDFYGLQSIIALTENGYTLKVKTTVFTVDDLETEITCETRVLGAKDLNISATPETTTTTVPQYLYPDEPSSDTWITYTGNGTQVVDVSSVDTNLRIMTVNASGGASIVSYNGEDYLDLLINKYGKNVNGEVVLFNFKGEQPTLLEVTAQGDWEIILKPVASARNFSTEQISGSGNEVIEFYENNSTFKVLQFVSETGVSVVSYECNGSYNDLVINQLGQPTDNSVRSDSGTCYLEVVGNGDWTISR